MGLQGKSAQRSPPLASAMLLLLLTSLAAAAMAQNENPIWFIPSGEKPSSQDEQTFCKAEQGKIADTELYQTRTSEILLTRCGTVPAPREIATTSAASSDLPARTSRMLLPAPSGTRLKTQPVTRTARPSASPSY